MDGACTLGLAEEEQEVEVVVAVVVVAAAVTALVVLAHSDLSSPMMLSVSPLVFKRPFEGGCLNNITVILGRRSRVSTGLSASASRCSLLILLRRQRDRSICQCRSNILRQWLVRQWCSLCIQLHSAERWDMFFLCERLCDGKTNFFTERVFNYWRELQAL